MSYKDVGDNEISKSTIRKTSAEYKSLSGSTYSRSGTLKISGITFTFSGFDIGAGGAAHDMYELGEQCTGNLF